MWEFGFEAFAVERNREEFVRTGLKRPGNVDRIVFGRCVNDVRVGVGKPSIELDEEVEATHIGEIPVYEDGVRHLLGAGDNCFLASCRLYNLVTDAVEQRLGDLADHVGVINDETEFHRVPLSMIARVQVFWRRPTKASEHMHYPSASLKGRLRMTHLSTAMSKNAAIGGWRGSLRHRLLAQA